MDNEEQCIGSNMQIDNTTTEEQGTNMQTDNTTTDNTTTEEQGTNMQTDNTTTEEQGTNMQTDNTTTQGATETERSGVVGQGESYHQMTVDDIVGRQFESVDEAEKFYQAYSTAIGFGIRRHRVTVNIKGKITRRRWVCCKEGKRDKKWLDKEDRMRNPTRETRENCFAALCVHLCKESSKYIITEFMQTHSHALARTGEVQFIRSHRFVNDSALAQVLSMRSASIPTSRAYDYIVNQCGGFEFVGFTAKDLFNRLDVERRVKIMNGDAQAAIAFMNARAIEDPDFYCKFQVDEEGRLANLFWRDSNSLYDYTCFGDVLIFDATYKTNIYKRPLAVFVGTNNHRSTIVFACALLVDEHADTYNWVLKTFLTSMKEKKPASILTDGDDAMRKAIVGVFPESRHRVCSWHVGNNLFDKIKDEDIRADFGDCIYSSLSVDEWEVAWQTMVDKYDLVDNPWIQQMYRKRERWAEAFFSGLFFGGMTSTQRCEGMNKNLKAGIGTYSKIYEILPRIERTLRRMRNDARKDDFNCRNSTPVLETHMRSLEDKMAKLMTHDMYLVARKQIMHEKNYYVTRRFPFAASIAFYLTSYKRPERRWTVEMNLNKGSPQYHCSCKLFESDGIPCAHIFCVMKNEQITTLPDSLICKRWTKEARAEFQNLFPMHNGSDQSLQMVRCAALSFECNTICYGGSLTGKGYADISKELAKVKVLAERYKMEHEEGRISINPPGQNPENVVRDPAMCRSKKAKQHEDGAAAEPSRTDRHCTYCTDVGHNKRTCSKRKADETAAKNNTVRPPRHMENVNRIPSEGITQSLTQSFATNSAFDCGDQQGYGQCGESSTSYRSQG